MARKRNAGGRRVPRRTAAQRRAYAAGVRRGKALAQAALTRKRKAAARKAAATRAAQPPVPKAPPRAVPELVLYEAPAAEAALFHLDWREFPVNPTEWAVEGQILRAGQVIRSREFRVPPEWDKEAAAATVRRELRAWVKTYHAEEPESEGYQAVIVRLALRAL